MLWVVSSQTYHIQDFEGSHGKAKLLEHSIHLARRSPLLQQELSLQQTHGSVSSAKERSISPLFILKFI